MSPNTHDSDKPQLREHVYDGIEEFDQKLPNWWLFTFYGAIVFSVIFWLGWSDDTIVMSDQEKVDVAIASVQKAQMEEMQDISNESLAELVTDEAVVGRGEATFMASCSPCHGLELTGGLGGGPNLIDAEWIHGNEPINIFNTITNGVIEKGMTPWGPILGPKRISEVTAFLLSKQP